MDPRRRAVCSLGAEDPTLLPHLRKLPQESHLEALVLHLYICCLAVQEGIVS